MDRALAAERAQRTRNPRGPRNNDRNDRRNLTPRDGVRKTYKDEKTNLDEEWVHDRFHDGPDQPRDPANDHWNRRRSPPREPRARNDNAVSLTRLRIENLHYEITEDDIHELFLRIGRVEETRLLYDKSGRSAGIAFVTFDNYRDAKTAVEEYDGANAREQPIRVSIIPLRQPPNTSQPRLPPAPIAGQSRSLFDRVEPPAGGNRGRGRSASPVDDDDMRIRGRRTRNDSGRTAPRRSPLPRGVGRGGRRPGARREDSARESKGRRDENKPTGGARPRKTAEELDAEMNDYWTNENNNGGNTNGQAGAGDVPAAYYDDDMIS
ncbi:RNA-binding domain-containing protein [Aulographum hederae CBS 113979]|uniref:RNA-binding domain-containing protein n=1 Tax=Aulographum hederae CBS 113979 TaxID=1176131 RepID=A0A6G1GIM2_9PEZI|nr:RNA-binding domain-containing protein [Aulographum hederae CBS 113979]